MNEHTYMAALTEVHDRMMNETEVYPNHPALPPDPLPRVLRAGAKPAPGSKWSEYRRLTAVDTLPFDGVGWSVPEINWVYFRPEEVDWAAYRRDGLLSADPPNPLPAVLGRGTQKKNGAVFSDKNTLSRTADDRWESALVPGVFITAEDVDWDHWREYIRPRSAVENPPGLSGGGIEINAVKIAPPPVVLGPSLCWVERGECGEHCGHDVTFGLTAGSVFACRLATGGIVDCPEERRPVMAYIERSVAKATSAKRWREHLDREAEVSLTVRAADRRRAPDRLLLCEKRTPAETSPYENRHWPEQVSTPGWED